MQSPVKLIPKLHSLLKLDIFPLCVTLRVLDMKKYSVKNYVAEQKFPQLPWTMASHHQKCVSLYFKIDSKRHYFENMNDFVVHNPNSSMIEVKNAWWSNMFCKSSRLSGNLKYRQITNIKVSGRISQSGTVFLVIYKRYAQMIVKQHPCLADNNCVKRTM
jgi:hypothetical protein